VVSGVNRPPWVGRVFIFANSQDTPRELLSFHDLFCRYDGIMAGGQLEAIIVGAGFGGMGAAIRLNRLGCNKIAILDREDDLGGTWHVNRYPRLTVDVPTTTYS